MPKLALVAGILSGVAALFACLGLGYWLMLPERFPVNRVEVKGNLEKTSRAAIEAALPRVSGNAAVNFFIADLPELRRAAERLPWVRRVSVRRVWPDRIELTVEEHVALARWGDTALVSMHGEKFLGRTDEALPAFVGPAGAEAEVARRYRRFSAIVAPLNLSVERVVLTPRHAWQLRLDNGQHLMLGRDADAAEVRLRRFVEFHASSTSHDYVDLRYPNGFAVRMPALKSGS